MSRFKIAAAAAAAALVLAAPAHAERIYGMTIASNNSTLGGLGLVYFDSATPGSVTTVGSFSGLASGYLLRSIDFRPATGELWAIATGSGATGAPALSAAQLYTVNLNTASLTAVGTGFTLTGNTNGRVEMDFNPTVDRIRIVTGGSTGNNFRANPLTGGLVQADTDLAYASGDASFGSPPSIVGAAYSNNVAGATTTTLYGWDYGNDALVTIGGPNGSPSPNGGQLYSVSQPVDFLTFNAALGMDISGTTGTLYVTHDDPGTATGSPMRLYTVNTATGAESIVGTYGGGIFVGDISVQIAAIPEPATWMMGAAGLAGLWLRRRQAAKRG